MSGGPDEYPDITNKEPQVKEIRTEPPEQEIKVHSYGNIKTGEILTSEQLRKLKGDYIPQPPTRFA